MAGFYDTETKELVVRGPHLTPFVRQVLVHELTHALDDQHFDLDPDFLDDEAALAFEALVEGDAVVVESRYLASLPEAERQAAAAEEEATFGGAGGRIPDIEAELGAFPYRDGPRLVAALLAAGGPGRLDAAFRSPPVSSAEVLHPERFLDGPGRATVPPVAAEGRVVDDGVLGEVVLRLVLAGSVPRDQAAKAAAGWAGRPLRRLVRRRSHLPAGHRGHGQRRRGGRAGRRPPPVGRRHGRPGDLPPAGGHLHPLRLSATAPRGGRPRRRGSRRP